MASIDRSGNARGDAETGSTTAVVVSSLGGPFDAGVPKPLAWGRGRPRALPLPGHRGRSRLEARAGSGDRS